VWPSSACARGSAPRARRHSSGRVFTRLPPPPPPHQRCRRHRRCRR
jgi:hypothetical protein